MLYVPAVSPPGFYLRETLTHENKDILTGLFITV